MLAGWTMPRSNLLQRLAAKMRLLEACYTPSRSSRQKGLHEEQSRNILARLHRNYTRLIALFFGVPDHRIRLEISELGTQWNLRIALPYAAPAAERVRRLRERRDRGVALVARIEISEDSVAALVESGRLVATLRPAAGRKRFETTRIRRP